MGTPDFLIIGAAKSGTTALDSYLDQHPRIRMCRPKETNFFSYEGHPPTCRGPGDEKFNAQAVTDLETYHALFESDETTGVTGESAPLYLYDTGAPSRIAKHCPNVKLIALLRNPVQRAYSSYMHMIRDSREPLPNFGLALDAESSGKRDDWEFLWHYRRVGYYGDQLSRYTKLFAPEQMLVLLYEDFQHRSQDVIPQRLRFLEMDDGFSPDMSIRPNMTGVPRNRYLNRLLTRPNILKNAMKPLLPTSLRRLATQVKAMNLQKPPMPHAESEFLRNAYQEDVEHLEHQLERDLSGWISV